jgi:hypothetical protein
MWLLPCLSMRADGSFRNLRATNYVKHQRRAARIGRTLAKARSILLERARAMGASPDVAYFFVAL